MRVDWSASTNDKIFGRFSFAEYESTNDKRAIPAAARQPHRRAVSQPGVQLEPHRHSVARQRGAGSATTRSPSCPTPSTGPASATPTRRSGSPAVSRFPGLSSIGWGNGLTAVGAGASDTDTLDKTYQINEKLTWLKGRHTVKCGGQFLHYVQQRFYAGNNGLLGLFGYGGTFTGFAVLRLPARSGDEQGTRQRSRSRGRTCTTASRSYVQDDFKVTSGADAQPRHAVGVHAAGRREGQPSVEFRSDAPASRSSPQDGDRESRALYKSYKKGFEPRLGVRLAAGRSLGPARRLRDLAVHGRDGSQPAAAAEPTVLLRIGRSVTTRRPVRARSRTGFAELRPLDQPSGQVRAWDPNLRPQFTQQWNVFAEYLLTPIDVGQHRLRRSQRRPSGDAGRGQPAAGRRRAIRRPGLPLQQPASAVSRRRRSSPTSRRPRHVAAATTTRCR